MTATMIIAITFSVFILDLPTFSPFYCQSINRSRIAVNTPPDNLLGLDNLGVALGSTTLAVPCVALIIHQPSTIQ